MRPTPGSPGCGRCFPSLSDATLAARHVEAIILPGDPPAKRSDNHPETLHSLGYAATKAALGRDPAIQALLYHSDYFALGGAKCLLERGLTIGKDVLVAGINNTSAVRLFPYPISSVEHDIKKIATALVEAAFSSEPCRLAINPIVHIRKLEAKPC